MARDIHLQADSKQLAFLSAESDAPTGNFFANAITPIDLQSSSDTVTVTGDEVGRIRIWITVEDSAVVSITTNQGSLTPDIEFFKTVNQGTALVAGAEFAFDVRVTKHSKFNIKSVPLTKAEIFIDQVNKE